MEALNPVDPQAFIGIDPDDTLVIPYGKGEFTLGVMPIGMWDRLNARQMSAFTNTKRLMIQKLAAEGRNPDEPLGSGSLLTFEVMKDDAFQAAMFGIRYDAVKFGLRSVKNVMVKTKAGLLPLPLERVDVKIDGFTCSVLSDASMRFFHANSACLEALWLGFRKLHDLGDDAKKA